MFKENRFAIKNIEVIPVIPVVKIENLENVAELAKALISGGMPCVEVTFTADNAVEVINGIKKACPQMLVGASDITNQLDDAIEAGADFIISVDAKIIEQAKAKNVAVLTGQTSEYNTLIPNSGTFVVPTELIEKCEFDQISVLCKKAIKQALGLKLRHVGINAANPDDANDITLGVSNLFMSEIRETDISYFISDEIEVMKNPFLGVHGHIAIGANNVPQAKAYFECIGYKFREETRREVNGKLVFIYFEKEIGGFAYHLTQN
ncbi:MAG: hypothetical protein BEN19_07470 [Epulopiscium sp. Nuni2H_MBin003]|nr:MAG: hypothetical protein BEN19_07470 [Epulopiscium sp. Nuni2H_MBin003]